MDEKDAEILSGSITEQMKDVFLVNMKSKLEDAMYTSTKSTCPMCGKENSRGARLVMSGPTECKAVLTVKDGTLKAVEYVAPEDVLYKYSRQCECGNTWTTEEK